MKLVSSLLFFFFFLFLFNLDLVDADANGGSTCAACALIIGLVEHLAQVHATDVISAADQHLCAALPSPVNQACSSLLEEFGPALIDGFYQKETPDIICHRIGLCRVDPGKEFCHLFPLPPSFDGTISPRPLHGAKVSPKGIEDYPICDLPGVNEVCKIIENFADVHLPLQDKDRDRFSAEPTLRGFHWRGKDCDDTSNMTYPGRKPLDMDRERDSNCNGIFGVDPSNGVPYEQLYCGDTNPRGIMVLGDSAAAHFHIPGEYFQAQTLSKDTFKDLIMILTNEFDWPQLSSVTAYMDNQWPDSIWGPVDSMYKRMLERNLCIHRDYQNIGVNGGDSGNMHGIMKGLARNRTEDYPLLVALALVGNDVCNGHVDTLSRMTSPAEYHSNMLTTLEYLDTTLPKGSTVVITGLADGRVLWDTMHDRFHPIGELNSDVKYSDLYGYLNCLEESPCTGWMNSNETLRNLTSERAFELSDIGKEIASNSSYKNIEVVYVDFDIRKVISTWVSRGGAAHEVIEPVDGFHPSQVGQALTAEYMFSDLMTSYPHVLGKVNPNNHKVKSQFGDQGGY